jgi:RimJ/RimL family protein N-acetyltransferase
MPLRPETVDRITAMWHRPAVRPNTISVVTLGADTFLFAPAFLHERVAPLDPTLDAVLQEFGDDVEKIVATVRLAYADDAAQLVPADAVEKITDDDSRQRVIEAGADHDEWLEASADEASDARYALLEDGDVVAIATLRIWEETVGSIGVFTDQRARGRGLAGAVASAAVRETLRRGYIAQWQSRVENLASARVADKLGFETLGGRVVVRVRQPSG